MTQLNDRNYRVANATANTFTLVDLFGAAINTTAFTAFTAGGTADKVYQITTPYAEADLFSLRYAQSQPPGTQQASHLLARARH